jgi:hypothetical protein
MVRSRSTFAHSSESISVKRKPVWSAVIVAGFGVVSVCPVRRRHRDTALVPGVYGALSTYCRFLGVERCKQTGAIIARQIADSPRCFALFF